MNKDKIEEKAKKVLTLMKGLSISEVKTVLYAAIKMGQQQAKIK